MSEAADDLARRVRSHYGLRPELSEMRMMGGLCFTLSGNMLVGPMRDGGLLVRVGKDNYAEALTRPGAAPMMFNGRPMTGFVEIDPDTLEDDEALADWLDYAELFVRTLPPKVKAPPKAKAPPKSKAAAKPAKPRKAPAQR
jgi:hypothetical protein